ncbi:release factor glutamine methyltransferase [Spirochaetia bacterium]|nr:release factor glutamine methyltransferase [Spirochaetia bacterium]
MTIREALTAGTARLAVGGIETPSLDAALFLADILNTTRTALIIGAANPLSDAACRRFTQSLDRRLAGVCTAYILGRREFRGLDFTVTPDVLVPRPDTETLVEAALTHIDRLLQTRGASQQPRPPIALLDLCTGSGAVAVSLKHERPQLAVYAADISPKAIAVARQNATKLPGTSTPAIAPGTAFNRVPAPAITSETPSPITFIESDLFNAFPAAPNIPRRFNIIVANPPYVPSGVIETLSTEVRREPLLALDGGDDGLDLIRRLITEAPRYLLPGGSLLLEADPGQMETITRILADQGYTGIQTYMDLSQRPRVTGGTVPA